MQRHKLHPNIQPGGGMVEDPPEFGHEGRIVLKEVGTGTEDGLRPVEGIAGGEIGDEGHSCGRWVELAGLVTEYELALQDEPPELSKGSIEGTWVRETGLTGVGGR